MPTLTIRKKDKIVVISGRDKGKTGEVIKVFPDTMKILVAKINIMTKHKKKTQTEPGAINKIEAPIHYSKVQLYCPKCEKPTRAKVEKIPSGESVRSCRRCAEQIL
jgi:large subunit ribosomal protein L24